MSGGWRLLAPTWAVNRTEKDIPDPFDSLLNVRLHSVRRDRAYPRRGQSVMALR